MTDYEFALTLHILSILALFSGVVVAAVAHGAARRREDPREIAVLLGTSRIGVVLVAAGSVGALAFGVWLIDLGPWSFSDGWISWSLTLFVVMFVLGALGGRRPKEARLLATRHAEEGTPAGPELRARLDDRFAAALNHASALAFLAIVVLMVAKP